MSLNPLQNLTPTAQFACQLLANNLNGILQRAVDSAASLRLNATEQLAREFPERLQFALSYYENSIKLCLQWLFTSREKSNFTYDLTDSNKEYLASTVSVVTGCTLSAAKNYIAELNANEELKKHIRQTAERSNELSELDPDPWYSRRLGWYAIVRALKPRVIVETGVDKGLGSCVLCAALERNASEGYAGRYYGTDINPNAGILFSGPYQKHGKILYGDSLQSLAGLNETIDLFINDSDHSAEYEGREYELVKSKLSESATILADNAHVTNELCKFSERTGRKFLFFQEKPKDHWYPGAGIGISFV
jgi:predicted O-methyltransferase YrrM